MAGTRANAANPICNLNDRQIGNDACNFREKLFRQRLASVQCMYRKDLLSHYGCVNAIEFSADGEHLISGTWIFVAQLFKRPRQSAPKVCTDLCKLHLFILSLSLCPSTHAHTPAQAAMTDAFCCGTWKSPWLALESRWP